MNYYILRLTGMRRKALQTLPRKSGTAPLFTSERE
jgi:hypothetical protein